MALKWYSSPLAHFFWDMKHAVVSKSKLRQLLFPHDIRSSSDYLIHYQGEDPRVH
jgi:hypothetical protein